MTPAQRHAYVEAHMTVQQHIAQANLHFQQQQQQLQSGSSLRQVIKENDQQSHHLTSQGSTMTSSSSHQHFSSNLKIPQISSSGSGSATTSTYTTVPDDGLGYDNGIRVLQSIGSWDIPPNIPRPNLIPFTEPYVEGGSLNPNSRLHPHHHHHPVTAKHHSTTSGSSSRKSRSSSAGAPKAFECTVCGKGLARKDKLTIHMRIHTVSP
jgi:hypothetical protein